MQTPNIFGRILNEIGIHDINVIDTISKREKFMIFVNEKDIMNTCNILYRFTKEANKRIAPTTLNVPNNTNQLKNIQYISN